MQKRGISNLVISIIFIGIIVGAIVLIIIIKNTQSSQQDSNQLNETISSEQVMNQTIPRQCSDYINQTSCESDLFSVSNSNHPEWSVLGCDNEGIECQCTWNSTESSCNLHAENITLITNQTNQTINLFLDVTAFNLSLKNEGCTSSANNTNISCSIGIVGILKNIGTKPIETKFRAHFLDLTNGTTLIKSFTIDTLASEAEKEVSFTYTNIPHDTYFIKFIVDPVSNLDESDEENNFIIESIRV
ncbi:MAG: hypothetical protein IIA87_01480 [Nanoarchaeota archaeon]|nr:hypothetical protein [Nanoarchaeota archaeon]